MEFKLPKKSSKRVPKLSASPPAQAVDGSATSVPLSVENPIKPLELVPLMELCLAKAAFPFAGSWENNDKFNSPRDYLEANLGDNAAPAPNAFAELAEHLRNAYRSLKQFQTAIAQQDWGGACLSAFKCGYTLMAGQRLLGIKAESISVEAVVSRLAATQAKRSKAKKGYAEAEIELDRLMMANPTFTKTAVLKWMADEKKKKKIEEIKQKAESQKLIGLRTGQKVFKGKKQEKRVQ